MSHPHWQDTSEPIYGYDALVIPLQVYNSSNTSHPYTLGPNDLNYYLQPTQTSTNTTHHHANAPILCDWDSACGRELDDVTPAGITRHLKQFHFVTEQWDDRFRGLCQWSGPGRPCGREMLYGGFGKHIASVHLKSISRRCPRCNGLFSRGDAVKRHLEQVCEAKNP